MNNLPFILSKRKESPYYQVRFKNPDDTSSTSYLPAKSTGETDYAKAMQKAFSMYSGESVVKESIVHKIKSCEITQDEAVQLAEYLKKNGMIEGYLVKGTPGSQQLIQFLLDFWCEDTSLYLKEKRRMGKNLGLTYIDSSHSAINKWWKPFFKDKLLQELTRRDLKEFILYLDDFKISRSRKLNIYRAGSVALKWAYNDELLDRDITAGIVSFSGEKGNRNILTKEVAELLFSYKWKDEKAQLANAIAMLTGMRAGEILALRKQDLGRDCIYVNHSWNSKEGLKTPKNGETRVVYFPFPKITQQMLRLVALNPMGDKMDSFIFWGDRVHIRPMDVKKLPITLRANLVHIGFPKKEAKKYCFHSWRHFYTTYMSDRVNQRVLQTQTGHKTLVMLEHYSSHATDNDMKTITDAQTLIFGDIVNNSIY